MEKQYMSRFRWVICSLLFFATTINYMDRQVLSLTWKDFIAPEFHWTDNDYGTITACFLLFYALGQLFAGRIIDWLGTKRGYLWSIGIWSVGACLHAFCGYATELTLGIGSISTMRAVATGSALAMTIATVSVYFFIAARFVLAIGEAGNFPVAIKVTAEYFPKKDRAFATSIFNSGASVGALFAPLIIPRLASYFKSIGLGNGWEMSFIIIGLLGFIWMGAWVFLYKRPEEHKFVNAAELAYIHQDDTKENETSMNGELSANSIIVQDNQAIGILESFKYRQAWAFYLGKFLTDAVWWFFLFWTPAYLSDVYHLPSSNPTAQWLIFVVYLITMLSIAGGWLPTYFVDKYKIHPYKARMHAMLIFAFFPLFALLAQPLGSISYWYPVIIVGIVGAAHQSWSANLYSIVSDMFSKGAVATIIGIGSMTGAVSSIIINKGSGILFDFAAGSTRIGEKVLPMSRELLNNGATYIREPMHFMGFEGKSAGYFIIFCICSVAYLIAWIIIKTLVPEYKRVNLKK